MQFPFPDYTPFEVQVIIVIAVILFVVWPVSSWIIGIGMRRKIRRDLRRQPTETDNTSIDTWMKVDEVEQRNELNNPHDHAGDKGSDGALARAIKGLFVVSRPEPDSGRRMRELQMAGQRNPGGIPIRNLGSPGHFAITYRLRAMVACAVFATIYSVADGAGWIPHTKVVTVTTISSSLIIGGGTYCYSHQTSPPQLITSLHCIGTPDEPHDLNVTFWGRNDTQTDRTWTCRPVQSLFHREASLTCTLQRPDYE